MDDLNSLSHHNVPVHWKEREHRWERRLTIDDEERNVVDFETIGEVVDARTALVRVSNNNDFVSSIYEFGR